MDAKEALDRVRVSPEDGDAWAVVRAELERIAARMTRKDEVREAAVAAVFDKLFEQAQDEDLPPVAHPPTYLGRALKWRMIDEERRRARRERLAAQEAAREAARREAEAREPEPFGPQLFALMERVFEKAVRLRDPWQREHLARAWRQIQALHVEDRALKDIVAEDEGIDPADEEAVKRAVQRAHKAHQRARAALLGALDRLDGSGIDPETAAIVRHAITRLKRRQDRPRPDVSTSKDRAHDR